MTRKHRLSPLAVLVAAQCLLAPAASAASYSFACITPSTASANCTAGANQMSVDVGSAGTLLGFPLVSFTFANSGPAASSIAEIYFDDGSRNPPGEVLGALISLDNGPSVKLKPWTSSPGDLPGGNAITPAFDVTRTFVADAGAKAPFNGVNPGEWVSMTFLIRPGVSYAGVIDALETPDPVT